MTQDNSPRFVPPRFIPTREQRDIQLSRKRLTLVEANAGAAKTTTLALRIGEALARGLPPEAILALTFTCEAKQVMRTRLVEVGIAPATASRIHLHTMDEFARDVLAALEDVPPLQLASLQNQRDAALAVLDDLRLRYEHKAHLLDIRTHNMAVSQFLGTLLRLKATMAFDRVEGVLDPEFAAEDLGVPLTDYLWALAYERRRLSTFGEVRFRGPFDATYDLARMLCDDEETRLRFPTYRLVVGDELHDLNEASFRILEALLGQDGLYFVGVGDRDQVIHAQFGADDQFLSWRFSERFPYAERYPLTMTYRHGPHLAYAMEAFKKKPIKSGLSLHTRIELLTYSDTPQDGCAELVVRALRAWESAGKPLNGCAILLRDRHQSIAIENMLMHADIGYRTETMPSYLVREEILFLRGMLAIGLDDLGAVKSSSVRGAIVEALATFGEIPLSPKAMEEAKRTITQQPDTLRFFSRGSLSVLAAKSSAGGFRVLCRPCVSFRAKHRHMRFCTKFASCSMSRR